MTHGLFPHLLLLSAFCGASLSCSSPSRDITIRSIPSGASLRVNGDYAGQAPVTLSLNRHKPVHVAADKPGFLPRKNVLSGNDHARSHFVGPQQREVQGLQNGHPDHPPEKGGFRSAPLAGTSRAVVTACRTRSGRESAYSSRARYAGPYRTPLSWTDPINPPVFLRPHANPPAPGGGP